MKLFSLYIVWSLLIMAAPFAQSKDKTQSPFHNLASDLMNLLSEGDIEGYRQLIRKSKPESDGSSCLVEMGVTSTGGNGLMECTRVLTRSYTISISTKLQPINL